MKLLLLLLSLIVTTSLFVFSNCALIEQTWVIDSAPVAADGVPKVAPVVNGQFPGPTLRGHVGDNVRIRVVNRMKHDSTSIHWHGVKQTGTPWSDGVPGITQCPILPGEQFVYEFMLDRPGTLWWHSHSGLQKSTLYGLIVITGDNVGAIHDRDIPLLLSDWFHETSYEQLAGLKARLPQPFKWVGDAKSLTFNGHGVYNCSNTNKICTQKKPVYIDVDEGQTYRVRIVGASSLCHLNLGIDAHSLTVVEAETTLVQPLRVRYLDVGAGTSYSALLKTYTRFQLDHLYPGHNGLFWIQTNVRHRKKGARGLAILRYSFARSQQRPSRPVPDDWPKRNDTAWSLAQARALVAKGVTHVPKPTHRIVLLGTQNRHIDGSLVWSMDNVSFVEQPTPLMQSVKLRIHEETKQWVQTTKIPRPFDYSKSLSQAGVSIMAKKGTNVVRVKKGEVVEVVLQNTLSLSGQEEIHPWHLHLHNFWVIAYGNHNHVWHENVKYGDTSRAVARNTVILYPQSWTVIRFVADNAGVAHFHCHIIAHLAMGMGLAVQIGDEKDIPPMPKHMPMCGMAKSKLKFVRSHNKKSKPPALRQTNLHGREEMIS